jgi:beta-glucosidase
MSANEPKIDFPFQNHHLSIQERIEELLKLLTLEEKINFLIDLSPPIPRLGIAKYYHGNECLHGVVRPGKATVFPQAIAFGATWDPDLIFQVATAISDEARAKHHAVKEYPGTYNGLLTFWSPDVNIARDPRWGRTPETYGEDPYLTSQIGIQFVKGIQGDHPTYLKAVSTPKHYVANNQEKNRFKLKPKISERWLRDYYLLAFKALITEGKAASIMGAYNAVFDIPCCHSKFLLTDVLRGEWGFDGYAVTDCGGVAHALPYAHNYKFTPTQAAASAMNAGIDLECGPIFGRGFLLKAVKKGAVTMKRLDEAVSNVLRARFKMGMFDPSGLNPYEKIPFSVVGSKKHSELALKCAQKSIVLLKNENSTKNPDTKLLPLDKTKIKSIAVVGPNADIAQFGDYSGVSLNTPVTPLMGLENILQSTDNSTSNIQLNFVSWIPFNATKNYTTISTRYLKPTGNCPKPHGLVRKYYPNQNFKGKVVQYFDEAIDVNYRSETPDPTVSNAQTDSGEQHDISERFSIKWKGFLCPELSGEYHIKLKASRIRFWQKPKLLFNNVKQKSDFKITLESGKKYPIEIHHAFGQLNQQISLQWKMPNFHPSKTDFNFEREIEAAQKSDIVLCYSGLGWGDEHEGVDRHDFQLSLQQQKLIRVLYEVNPNMVLILIAGSNLAINWEQQNIPAILHAWYPGERGGDAIAQVLFGGYNPAGRLPMTFYDSVEQIPSFDDYEIHNGKTYWFLKEKPLYPFGFGLSYTTFSYSNLFIAENTVSAQDEIKISVDVKNVGKVDGEEVVQMYVSYEDKSNNKPIRQLKGFERIHIPSGKQERVEFQLKIQDLGFWNSKSQKYEVEVGKIGIEIGSSSADIHLTSNILIK